MEAILEEVSPTKTAIMVVYDHDNTKSKRHSAGVLYQCAFENPWARNIRVFPCFQQHIRLLQSSENPTVILGVATFGEYRERIVGSWGALGVAEDSILICAKYVRKAVARRQGKNMHIAMLLQEHYRRHPEIKITGVYLMDDDEINIHAAKSYPEFIKQEPWNSDIRLDVPIEAILVPRPELIVKPSKSLHAPVAAEAQTHIDKHLNMEVDTEHPLSEWRFLRSLNLLEQKLGLENKGVNFRLFEPRNPSKKEQSRKCVPRRLTRSFDKSVLLEYEPEPLKERVNLKQSADNWNNLVLDVVSEDEENLEFDDTVLLFRSV